MARLQEAVSQPAIVSPAGTEDGANSRSHRNDDNNDHNEQGENDKRQRHQETGERGQSTSAPVPVSDEEDHPGAYIGRSGNSAAGAVMSAEKNGGVHGKSGLGRGDGKLDGEVTGARAGSATVASTGMTVGGQSRGRVETARECEGEWTEETVEHPAPDYGVESPVIR